jgi:hypothetical protein
MAKNHWFQCVALLAGISLGIVTPSFAEQPGAPAASGSQAAPASPCEPAELGSPYIPVDSWVYPAMLRLYSLGFVDHVFLGMRPWTRASLSQMLEDVDVTLQDATPCAATDEAQDLYQALTHEVHNDMQGPCLSHQGNSRIDSVYSIARAISGTPLRDSYHLGSTIVNDYGRPYANGFNNYTGASGYAAAGRFLLFARGEFQGAPSTAGYSTALAQTLSTIDGIPFLDPNTNLPYSQPTIPLGPIASVTHGRVVEAYASGQFYNHIFSFGKQDDWLGPGLGGGMAYSNNAENIYSFRINRIEPLAVPLLSRLTGPFRYEFMIGPLKGHTYIPVPGPKVPGQRDVYNPSAPWMHLEKVSFRPTQNLEFGFERTVIWGGKGHEPITLHTFLRSFFSLSATTSAIKFSPQDPGARFGAFDFSYRLPFVRNWFTLYSDSEVHDDVSPIDAPRRAAIRPGIYLSHVPGIAKLDMRLEVVSTDPAIRNSIGGSFMYIETVQKQGYTNNGVLFGDWIGREGKGGQGWITYHLSGNEWIQVGLRNQKVAKDFIPGGTTLNDINFQVVKQLGKDFELNGNFSYEGWKAPIYLPGKQNVTTTTIQLTWFPERKISF